MRNASRLFLSTLCACLIAPVLFAQRDGLATVFPRETVYFAEYRVTEGLRSLLSEEQLIDAGVKPEQIEEFYHEMAEEFVRPHLLRGASDEDVKAIATGFEAFAFGAIDWQLSGLEEGIPVNFMLAAEHRAAGRLNELLQMEVEAGNPAIMEGPFANGVSIYEISAPAGEEDEMRGMRGMPGQVMNRIGDTVGLLGIVDNRYLIFTTTLSTLLDASDRLHGELEGFRLTDKRAFHQTCGALLPNTVTRNYISVEELVLQGSRVKQVEDVIVSLELNKILSFGGWTTWDTDANTGRSEIVAVMRNDDLPEWYEIMRCVPKAPTLMRLTSEDAFMTAWSGMDDLKGRGESLAEYFKNATEGYRDDLERVAEEGMRNLPFPRSEPGMPGPNDDGMPEDFPEDERQGMPPEEGEFPDDQPSGPDFELLEEIFYMLGDQQLMCMAGVPPQSNSMFVAALIAADTSEDELMNKIAVFANRDVLEAEDMGEGFRRYDMGDQMYVVIGNGMVIGGTQSGVDSALTNWTANATKRYDQLHSNALMIMNFRALRDLVEDMPMEDGQFPVDPSQARLGMLGAELFFNMRIVISGIMERSRMVMRTQMNGLPGHDEIREFIRLSIEAGKQEAGRENLAAIQNAMVFSEYESDTGLRATSIQELIDLGLLDAENLKDPIDPDANEDVHSYVLAPVPADALAHERFLLAYQREAWLEGGKRLAITLDGEIVELDAEEFAEALKAANAEKVMPPKKARNGEVPSEDY